MSFFEPGTDCRVEVARMVELAERLLAIDPEEVWLDAGPFREGLVVPMGPLLRAETLPPCALALAAGGCAAFASIKDYALRPYLSFARALHEDETYVANFDPERPLVMSPGEIPNPRSALAALDAALRTEVERFATAALDEARARLRDVEAKLSEPTLSPTSAAIYQGELDSARLALARLTGQTAPNAPSRRLMAVADRVALLGFGDQLWDLLPQERRALHRMQHVGVPAQALLHAIDAVAAGSHAAIESLDTLARAHPGHAWLDYLVEVAQRISRAPSVRVARPSAPLLPTSHALDSAREMLDAETLGPAADAWLTLGAHHERGAHARAEGLDADLQTDLDLDEDEHPDDIAAAAAEREAIQRECGPFYELSPPEAAREAVAEAVWPLLVGFRSLYGLELVTEALPQARAWLAQQMDSA